MNTLNRTDWEVLNATADDCEDLEQIFLAICFEYLSPAHEGEPTACCYQFLDGAPSLREIAEAIRALVRAGLLEIVMDEEGRAVSNLDDPSYVWRGWFQMTPQGRAIWQSSDIPPTPQKSSATEG
jgi:hypothetical protein